MPTLPGPSTYNLLVPRQEVRECWAALLTRTIHTADRDLLDIRKLWSAREHLGRLTVSWFLILAPASYMEVTYKSGLRTAVARTVICIGKAYNMVGKAGKPVVYTRSVQ